MRIRIFNAYQNHNIFKRGLSGNEKSCLADKTGNVEIHANCDWRFRGRGDFFGRLGFFVYLDVE